MDVTGISSPSKAHPLVSILIPTHNRPAYFELALRSALSQTYSNIEVVVSDNSDDDLTKTCIAPYLDGPRKIRYSRVANSGAIQNFHNCYKLSEGEYINYLMDDDLFHPQKIEKMMVYMAAMPNVGIVTSVRQPIDENGNFLGAAPPFDQIFFTETRIEGRSLGHEMLTKPGSIVGEPTTALFRRSNLNGDFGQYCSRQYQTMSDVATWLSILSQSDCVYLPEALSYFRIHAAQDQRQRVTWIRANIEGLNMLCDSYQAKYFLPNTAANRAIIASNLAQFLTTMVMVRDELAPANFQLTEVLALIQRASGLLLRD
jgi:glycosyltransferase involved in cell wall biosynthesis